MMNVNTIAKGGSDVGGNSPIGSGEIQTVAGLIAVGVIGWTVTVPANERWLLVGMKSSYTAGTVTTSARKIELNLPGGLVPITFYPNVNEFWEFECGVGLPDKVQPDLTNPNTGKIFIGIPENTWLNPGDVIGMNGVTFDVDTVWQFNSVRIIKYNV